MRQHGSHTCCPFAPHSSFLFDGIELHHSNRRVVAGDKLVISSAAGRTSSFEVTLDGDLIHSKLTKGHGKCNTPSEQQAVLVAIEKALV